MKKLMVMLLAIMLLLPAFAQAMEKWPMQGDVCVYVENEKAGLMDEAGNIILPAKYDYITAFNGGDYAIAGIENDKGIVSRDGRELLAPEWISVQISKNGRLAVYYDEYAEQYLMDLSTGEVLIEPGKNIAIDFSGDYVCLLEYGSADFSFYPPYTTTVYDQDLNRVGLLDAWVIRDFAPYSKAEFNDGHYGIVAPDGTILIRGLERINDFQDGYASYVREEQADRDNKISICGLVDVKGNVVEAPGVDMKPANEGLYIVKTNGMEFMLEDTDRYGYVNSVGEMVIPAEYQRAYAFIDGAAVVCKDGEYFLIDIYGNRIGDLSWKWTAESYSFAVFEMPLVAVGVDGGYRLADRRGAFVSDEIYTEINTEALRDENDLPFFFASKGDGRYYLVGMDGKLLYEEEFSSYGWAGNDSGYVWLETEAGYGRFDLANRAFTSEDRYADIPYDGAGTLNDGNETAVQTDQAGNAIGPDWVDPDASGFFW